jgi:hypothetical protein
VQQHSPCLQCFARKLKSSDMIFFGLVFSTGKHSGQERRNINLISICVFLGKTKQSNIKYLV